jgi:outer membrane receptor protein involved in Fe transport
MISSIGAFRKRKKSSRFLKKAAQKFLYAGPWARSATTPTTQITKVFLLLFVHKKKSFPCLSVLLACCGLAYTCCAVHAQTPTSVTTTVPAYTVKKVLIQVAPLGGGIDISKWPQPVQLFSGKDLTHYGTANLTATLNDQAAGVNLLSSQANPYQPTILYHGFEISPIQGTPAGLSVYVNGARFNAPFGDVAIWSVLPEDAIQSLSIEDQNPAFGLNALGGAISIRMKDGFSAQGGEASLSGGSFEQITGNLQYGKKVGNAATYVDVGVAHEGGWRDAQSSDIQNFYGDIGWRGPHSTLHFNVILANSKLNGPGTVPVQLLDADPAAQFTGPNSIADKYAKLGLTFDTSLNDDTTLQTVLYYDNLWEHLINGNGSNDLPCAQNAAVLCQQGGQGAVSTSQGGQPIPAFLPGPNAYGYYSYGELNLNTTNTNGYGGTLQVTHTSSLGRLVLGVSYDGGFTSYGAASYVGGLTTQSRVFYTPAGIPSPGYLLDEPGALPVDVGIRNAYEGLYLSDTVALTKKMALTVGGRWNLATIVLHDENPADAAASSTGLSGRHFYERVNPTVGLTYQLFPQLTLYGAYSQANAAPTPAELSCASPEDSCSLANFMSGDPNLKQIVSRNVDFGLRGAAVVWGDITLGYDADYFMNNTSDDIEFLQSPLNPVGSGYFANIGNVRRTGFDVSVHANSARWQGYFDYSYIAATYESAFVAQSNSPAADADGNIQVQKGDYLPGIPKNIIKLGVSYWLTPKWMVGVSAIGETSSFLYGDQSNQTAPLPGYFVVNLTSHYQLTKKLQVFGTIYNMTDTRYYDYGTFSPVGGVYVAQVPGYSDPRSYSIAAPISVTAGIKVTF